MRLLFLLGGEEKIRTSTGINGRGEKGVITDSDCNLDGGNWESMPRMSNYHVLAIFGLFG